MWGAAAIRIFALFAHACSQGPWAQPQANSIDWQEHDKQSQATSHAANPENRQPLQNVVVYGLQTTLQNAVFGQMQLAGNITKRWVWRS